MHVFLIAALSLDGFIARDIGQNSTDWTSKEDTAFFRERTKQAGVVVLGRKTFETIGRPLPGRVNVVMSRDVSRQSLVASHQDVTIMPQSHTAADRSNVHTSASLDTSAIQALQRGEVGFTSDSPEKILHDLDQSGFDEVAICGGSSVYDQFLSAGLIQTLYLTIEPVLFGRGVKLAELDKECQLRLKSLKQLNERGTILLEYAVESKLKR